MTGKRDSLLRQAMCLRTDKLGQRVARGAGYQMFGILARTVLTIGSTAVLARLLAPSDFGYLAMATVVTEFAALLGNFGFTGVLVQRHRISRLAIDTVFWAALATGALLALLVFAISPMASTWFADPMVAQLLPWLGLNFVVASLSTIPGVVLSRLMRFRTEFWTSMLAVVIRTAVAIGLAWSGLGVWSLVIATLVGSVAQVLLQGLAVPYLPRWRFDWRFIQGAWRASAGYFGNGLLFYANMNVDLLVIGRTLGATPLGYYQNARSLTDEIRTRIAIPLQQVLFPAFSALQHDRPRAQAMVLRSARLLAAVTVPIGIGVSALAPELVAVLYGPKWMAMVPVMALFGISAAFRAGTAIMTPLFNSQNRPGLSLRYNVVASVLMVAAILWALPHGLERVALAVAVVSSYTLVPYVAAFRLIGMGLRDAAQVLGPVAAAGAGFWGLLLACRPWAEVALPMPGLRLLAGVLLGALTYLLMLHALSRRYIDDLGAVAGHLRAR